MIVMIKLELAADVNEAVIAAWILSKDVVLAVQY